MNNREKIVIKISIISIISNIILASFKAIVGLVSNSIAIISDAINNFSDALSSIITIVGTKLASLAPDKNHPFGYGRIEYMTSLIVSMIVLYAGIASFIESFKKIINPEKVDYSLITLIILIVGIIIKFVLGLYVKKKGKDVNSNALVASGSDAFNDAILSISVLVSKIIYLIFKINLEAYVGIILSIFIIKSGFLLVKESVDNMLGSRVESSLAKSIKKDILNEKDILGVYDLVLNDYGPDRYLGSVHIEVLDTMTVAEVDKISRKITKLISSKYGILLHTIGVYSVNTKDKKIIDIKKEITKIVFKNKTILEMHGFYIDKIDKIISFDIIIDFKEKNKEEVFKRIYEEVKKKYKDYYIEITLDVDTSD